MSNRRPLAVLYVDDDQDIRQIVTLSLALDPAIILKTCASGAEAINLISGGDWRPDLFMLDVNMPKLDGPSLMNVLRGKYGIQDTPFIFVTARAREADVRTYYAVGAIGVVLKPFDPVTLALQIRSMIDD